jgi:hypothetical protein
MSESKAWGYTERQSLTTRGVGRLDSDEDAEFMDLARLLAMGGQPAMQSLFGGASKQCPRRSNNATQQQQDKHHGKQERASTDGDAEVAKSSQPLVVGASVQVYGRLAGVSDARKLVGGYGLSSSLY